jgi:hypothetical protein
MAAWTSYPAIMDALRPILGAIPAKPALILDATVLGRPVVELVRKFTLAPNAFGCRWKGEHD